MKRELKKKLYSSLLDKISNQIIKGRVFPKETVVANSIAKSMGRRQIKKVVRWLDTCVKAQIIEKDQPATPRGIPSLVAHIHHYPNLTLGGKVAICLLLLSKIKRGVTNNQSR